MKFKVYRHFAESVEGKDIFIVEANSEEEAKLLVMNEEELEPEEHIIDYEYDSEYLSYEVEPAKEDSSC